jgi:hypothetical protein
MTPVSVNAGCASVRAASNATIVRPPLHSTAPEQITVCTDGVSPSTERKTFDKCPSVSNTLAALSFRMYASLSALVCGLITTNTPPASSAPKIDTTHGHVLSM